MSDQVFDFLLNITKLYVEAGIDNPIVDATTEILRTFGRPIKNSSLLVTAAFAEENPFVGKFAIPSPRHLNSVLKRFQSRKGVTITIKQVNGNPYSLVISSVSPRMTSEFQLITPEYFEYDEISSAGNIADFTTTIENVAVDKLKSMVQILSNGTGQCPANCNLVMCVRNGSVMVSYNGPRDTIEKYVIRDNRVETFYSSKEMYTGEFVLIKNTNLTDDYNTVQHLVNAAHYALTVEGITTVSISSGSIVASKKVNGTEFNYCSTGYRVRGGSQ